MNVLSGDHPLLDGRTEGSALVQSLRGSRTETTPVWFMRQAGRSLPEYRELRAGKPMLESCLTPEVASEVTLQPVRRHGVDAAIFFSDIIVPLALAGVDVEIAPGRGPVFGAPLRTREDVEHARREFTVERLHENAGPIREAVALTVAELGSTPLIGFAGAPFTLAAYLVEGAPSRDHLRARQLMHSDPETWAALVSWAAELSGAFLEEQVLAGASAVQLFDSWAGSLSAVDYRANVAPFSALALDRVRALEVTPTERVPIIHFAVGSGHLLEELAAVGPSALGVDWRTPLDEASARLGDAMPLQGNLDPAYLGAPRAVREAHVLDVLARGRRAPAHVLNLGHGVPPEADPDTLTHIVEFVHAQ